MESVQRIISAETIARLTDGLYGEPDPERCLILQQRWLEAENRYGRHSEQLDMLGHYLREISDRIDRQRSRVEEFEAREQDPTLARNLLNNLITARREFERYQGQLIDAVGRTEHQLCAVGPASSTGDGDARVRHDQRASSAEQSLRLILECAPNAMIMIGRSGAMVMVNAEAERIFGYPRSELLGRSVEMLIPERFRADHAGMRAGYFSEMRARPMGTGRDLYGLRKDGREFPVEIGLNPIETEDGTVVLASIIDITGRKAAELALRQSEHRSRSLAAIVESSGDAIVSVGLDGLLVSWNKAAEHMFGYTEAEMLGQPILTLAAPGYEAEMTSIFRRILRGERVDHYETMRRHKDGSLLHVSLTESPIYDADGQLTGVSKVYRDITRAKAAETALEDSRARLQELHSDLLHVSRLSAMGQMAASLAHELNQPLTAISNYMEAVKALLDRSGNVAPNRLRAVVERAGEQAVRAGQIIQRLREFVSRGDTDKRIEFLPPLLREARELALLGTRQRDIPIYLEDNIPELFVFVDKIQIQQVLLNLLRNAAEAIAEQDDGRIVLGAAQHADGIVEISVADNGSGLPEEIRTKLFQPFVSTKKTGMGIGLSICHTIISAHNGRLWAESNSDGGTVFRMTLSRASVEEAADA
jgi:two-component system, LuxR family, sensor kinase FixL